MLSYITMFVKYAKLLGGFLYTASIDLKVAFNSVSNTEASHSLWQKLTAWPLPFLTNNDVVEEHWNANYIHEQWKIDYAYSNFQGSQTIESSIISLLYFVISYWFSSKMNITSIPSS